MSSEVRSSSAGLRSITSSLPWTLLTISSTSAQRRRSARTADATGSRPARRVAVRRSHCCESSNASGHGARPAANVISGVAIPRALRAPGRCSLDRRRNEPTGATRGHTASCAQATTHAPPTWAVSFPLALEAVCARGTHGNSTAGMCGVCGGASRSARAVRVTRSAWRRRRPPAARRHVRGYVCHRESAV